MSINNLKGTLYDFLGYFAPGLIGIIYGYISWLRYYNNTNIFEVLKEVIEELSVAEVFLLILSAYILGHAIASLSSLGIEKWVVGRIGRLKSKVALNNILGNEHYEKFCEKYQEIFRVSFSDKDIRKVICYVQAKQNSVYETAMIFLSFYGMARNILLVCIACLIGEVSMFKGTLLNVTTCVVLGWVFWYEYIRFRKYFLDTISSGFLIPEQESARGGK